MNHLVWYREAPVHSYDLADWMNQHLELQEINLNGIIWFIWFFLYLHFRRSWWKGIIEVLLHLLSPLQVGEGDGQGLQHLHLLPGDHLLLPPREEEGGEAEHRGAGEVWEEDGGGLQHGGPHQGAPEGEEPPADVHLLAVPAHQGEVLGLLPHPGQLPGQPRRQVPRLQRRALLQEHRHPHPPPGHNRLAW